MGFTIYDLRLANVRLIVGCLLVASMMVLVEARAAETEKDEGQSHVVVVVGAAGERKYGEMFGSWAMRVKEAAKKAEAKFTLIGINESGKQSDLDRLKDVLSKADAKSTHDLWLVLIGHGTWSSRAAKFNMRGPDLSANQLDDWLEPLERPLAIINCSSCSAPFLKKLMAPNRVIVSATKSGNETTFAQFGDYFTSGLAGEGADLDKDEQVSLLELFLTASKNVYAFYEQKGELATEHALLEDNGDGLGSRAEWFRGVRSTKKPSGGGEVDGHRAHQIHLLRSEFEKKLSPELRAERDRLEMSLIRHRNRKDRLKEDLYYTQLGSILIKISRIYAQAEEKLQPKLAPKPKKPVEDEKKAPAPKAKTSSKKVAPQKASKPQPGTKAEETSPAPKPDKPDSKRAPKPKKRLD